jgi:hypothetical protein
MPGRQPIPTYLRGLDRQWRGGWFWQWPILIAGPEDAGKSLFLAQMVASSLLSCRKPWQILYYDFNGDYQAQRILRVLNLRSQVASPASYLSRIDKLTLTKSKFNDYFFMPMIKHPLLAVLVVDGWNSFFPSADGLRGLANLAIKKQMGLIVTLRGNLFEMFRLTPWDSFPYLFYITKQKHKQHRIRVWQNSSTTQIYERVVAYKGYFVEPRTKKGSKPSHSTQPAASGLSHPSRG